MTTNPDILEDAGRIVCGETMMLATGAHLEAVTQLVREAKRLYECGEFDPTLNGSTPREVAAWLRDVDTLLAAAGRAGTPR